MRSGVATFVAMRHMSDRFIRLYRTIDLRDRYLSMYSATLALSHCGLNLVKGSRDNFWGVHFFKKYLIMIIIRYQHAILIFKLIFCSILIKCMKNCIDILKKKNHPTHTFEIYCQVCLIHSFFFLLFFYPPPLSILLCFRFCFSILFFLGQNKINSDSIFLFILSMFCMFCKRLIVQYRA